MRSGRQRGSAPTGEDTPVSGGTTSRETHTWSHGTDSADQLTSDANDSTQIGANSRLNLNIDTRLDAELHSHLGASRLSAHPTEPPARTDTRAVLLDTSLTGNIPNIESNVNLGANVSTGAGPRPRASINYREGANSVIDLDMDRHSIAATVVDNVSNRMKVELPGPSDSRISRLRAESELRATQLEQARAAAAFAATRYELLLAEHEHSHVTIPPVADNRLSSWVVGQSAINNEQRMPRANVRARSPSPPRVNADNHRRDSNGRDGEIGALRDAIVQAIGAGRDNGRNSQSHQINKYIGDLPHFDGNPSDWIAFKRVYLDTESAFSDITNMGRLRKAVKGAARESVKMMINTCSNPYDIIDSLDRVFGKPDVIILSEIQNIKRMSRMAEDGRNISEFSNKIGNIVASVSALEKPQYLYAPELVGRIVDKMNNIVRYEWFKYKSHNEHMPELLALSQFLKDISIHFSSMFAYEQSRGKAGMRSRPVNNVRSRLERRDCGSDGSSETASDCDSAEEQYVAVTRNTTRNTRSNNTYKTKTSSLSFDYDSCSESDNADHYVAATRNATAKKKSNYENKTKAFSSKFNHSSRLNCVICSGEHNLTKCADFVKLTVADRWETVKQAKLCFRCLASSHKSASERCSYNPCGKGECEASHHPLLHGKLKREEIKKESVNANNNQLELVKHARHSQAFLKIIPVEIQGPKGCISAHALMDEGSTITLIERNTAHEVTDPGKTEPLMFEGVGGNVVTDNDSSRVKLSIRGSHSREFHDITARSVGELNLAAQSVNHYDLRDCTHLRPIEHELCYDNAKPTILIGQDNWHLIVSRHVTEGTKTQPAASLTSLGWVLHGISQRPRKLIGTVNHIVPIVQEDTALTLMKEHFSLDSLGIEPRKPKSDPEDRAMMILNSTCRKIPGTNRYEAGLLWKSDNEVLPNNSQQALRRLYSLEKKLDNDPKLKEEYNKQINNLIAKGYAEPVDAPADSPRAWFLPHFAVIHPQKQKYRVVFDAASKTCGKSLNDALLSGPDLIQSLYGVLIRFREGRIAVISDVKEMFLQIKMREEDRDSLRFFWRGDARGTPPKTYRMTSLIFGAASSPCTAIYVKNQNANEHRESYPEVARLSERNFYVDDFCGAFDTIEQARTTISDMDRIFKKASLELRSWASNEPTVIDSVKNISNETTTALGKSNVERTLGLFWNHRDDTIGFNLNLRNTPSDIINGDKAPTKRQVTSAILSVFDPTGLATPVTILGKMLIQDIWRTGITWDDCITPELQTAWQAWLKSLDLLQNLQISRHIPKTHSLGELHVFCDASEKAYASVLYYVSVSEEGERSAHLITSKARVTPLKPVSIPRLELQSTILGCRLADSIKRESNYVINKCYYWTDSRTVLAWINADPRAFKPFVAHRLAEVESFTSPKDWRWLRSADNVADDATRGIKSDFNTNHRWFKGPHFLLDSPDSWPSEKPFLVEPPVADIERKQSNVAITNHVNEKRFDYLPDPNRFSRYIRLQRVTGRLLLAVEVFARKQSENPCNKDMTSRHLLLAELLILRRCQQESFTEEHERLRKQESVHRTSKLNKLTVKLEPNGLITLDGRYQLNSSANQSRPVLLDIKHHVTRLIVHYYHEQFNHANHSTVINELQQKYHVIGLRSYIRNIHTKCQWCKLHNHKPVKLQQGDLPKERMMHHQPPFTATAVDFFGPLKVTVGRRQEKRWGALYTCLTTRAVHVELAASLSASSMISTLRRMMARRGAPTVIFSDNATNFIGSEREIQDALDSTAFNNYVALKRIVWKKIPPGAPSMGGAWEIMVKAVKKALFTTLRDKAPHEDTLHTLLLEAEHIVNSRPLTPISCDLNEEALTPNHFLIQRSNGMLPFGSFTDKNTHQNSWQEVQQLADRFWNKWVKEYQPLLLPRMRASDPPNLKPGDVVLIADNTMPRGTWPRGRIEKVYPGPDGKVRVTEVKIATGLIRRPASRLILIVPSDSQGRSG